MNIPITTTKLAYLLVIPSLTLGGIFLVVGLVNAVSDSETGAAINNISSDQYPASDIQAGEDHFRTNCSTCHGLDAKGISGLGKNLTESEFVQTQTDEELREFIIEGRSLGDPQNTTGVVMPPRGGNPTLNDKAIDQIIAYLRTRTQEDA